MGKRRRVAHAAVNAALPDALVNADGVELGDRIWRQHEFGRSQVFDKVTEGRGARDQQDVGLGIAYVQASATCIGVAFNSAATCDRTEDCSGENPPSGKNGT
jgi:hypothetical protein